jgi:uncharacterized membrane-anchored protein
MSVTVGHGRGGAPGPSRSRPMLNKVPEVTALFWVTKVLTTAMGEVTSDYVVKVMDPFVAVGLGAVGLAVALVIQLQARSHVPWRYWLAVVMVAVFGTMAADVLHVQFGVPYLASTTFFAVVIAASFVVWHRVEGTLSVHSISTRRRELFYWFTVMSTFALGTAVGDMTAKTMHLGYLSSGLLFTVLIALPALAYRYLRLDGVAAFWAAYILTRPVGASFADWLGKPRDLTGLGVGDLRVDVLLTVAILGLVAYLSATDRSPAAPAPATT